MTLLAEFPPILQTLRDQARGGELSSLRVVTGPDNAETIARLEREWPGATFWVAFGSPNIRIRDAFPLSRETRLGGTAHHARSAAYRAVSRTLVQFDRRLEACNGIAGAERERRDGQA